MAHSFFFFLISSDLQFEIDILKKSFSLLKKVCFLFVFLCCWFFVFFFEQSQTVCDVLFHCV